MRPKYPPEKMIPRSAFGPFYHMGLRPGKRRRPSKKFPGWFACFYGPKARQTVKRHHVRRCRRCRARLITTVLVDLSVFDAMARNYIPEPRRR